MKQELFCTSSVSCIFLTLPMGSIVRRKKQSTDQWHGEIHVSPVRGHGGLPIRKHGGVDDGRQMMNRDQNSEAAELDGMCTGVRGSKCRAQTVVLPVLTRPSSSTSTSFLSTFSTSISLCATLLDTLLSLSSL
jgi:hypothetical protein